MIIRKNTLDLNNGKKAVFPFPIAEAVETENAIVICLNIPLDQEFNENVFAVDHEGIQLWQVKPMSHGIKNSPYVGLSRQGALVRLHNVDGTIYDVEPTTGKVVRQMLAR